MRGRWNKGEQPDRKVCKSCGLEKSTKDEFFWLSGNGYTWPQAFCKVCHTERCKKYRESRLDKYAEYRRAGRKKNPEQAKAWDRTSNKRRKMRKKFALVKESDFLTESVWKCITQLFFGKCVYCLERDGTTQDHVIPVSKGGKHVVENVLPACTRCNSSKNNKPLDEWRPDLVGRVNGATELVKKKFLASQQNYA